MLRHKIEFNFALGVLQYSEINEWLVLNRVRKFRAAKSAGFALEMVRGTDLHKRPRVLLSSALCSCGYWSASWRRASCAHTMNAFIGRLTCVSRFSGLDLEAPVNNHNESFSIVWAKAHAISWSRTASGLSRILLNYQQESYQESQ